VRAASACGIQLAPRGPHGWGEPGPLGAVSRQPSPRAAKNSLAGRRLLSWPWPVPRARAGRRAVRMVAWAVQGAIAAPPWLSRLHPVGVLVAPRSPRGAHLHLAGGVIHRLAGSEREVRWVPRSV
jgi:hypothetical protein